MLAIIHSYRDATRRPNWYNSRVRSRASFVCLLLLAAALPAQTPAGPRPVNQKRLVEQGSDNRVHLTTAGKVAPEPFTGVAFVEEEWGRAELTYSNGILHGPVVVVVRNRVFSQFEYENGKRVLKE